MWSIVFVFFISFKSVYSRECVDLFSYSDLIRNGKNQTLSKAMQDLQFHYNVVNQFISKLNAKDKTEAELLQIYDGALFSSMQLVHLTRLLAEESHGAMVPPRLLDKPVGERERYLEVYRMMYLNLLKTFLDMENTFKIYRGEPLSVWNFSNVQSNLMSVSTIMAHAHMKY